MDPITSREFLKLGTRDFDNGAVREAIYKAIKRGEGEARPLRWRTGLPLGDKGELTEDVFIEWQGNWMKDPSHCLGIKGDHPVMDNVSWSRYIPLSEILALVED